MHAVAVVLLALAGTGLVAPPKGRKPENVDHGKPKSCLAISKRTGDAAAIKKLAKTLRADDPEQTLRNVCAYVAAVPNIPHRGWLPDHQDFATLSAGFDQRDCARHALLFGTLTRACGIPTVYVKSMRHDWIRAFRETGETGNFAGHVFLEVHVGNMWKLVDAQGMRIWDDYDPDDPELPGGLHAYEKGIDHHAMVHSTRRDLFKSEALARFADVDVGKLRPNAAQGRPLLRPIHALTLATEWKALGERTPGIASFNDAFWAQKRESVRGGVLVITSMGGRVGLPRSDVDEWLPIPPKKLAEEFAERSSGVHERRLDDGTLVVLLAAPGWAELMTLIWSTDFTALRCTPPE